MHTIRWPGRARTIAVLVALTCSSVTGVSEARERPDGKPATARTFQAAVREAGRTLVKDRARTAMRAGQGPARRTSTPPGGVARGALIAGGVVAGMYAGAQVGAALEGDCQCDDPGMRGALIGMPIGGVLGGLAVAWLTR